MLTKKTRLFFLAVLLGLATPTEATLTFTEAWEYTANAWGITAVSTITAAAIFAIKCGCKCVIGCCRRRMIKKRLGVFNAKELLDGMAKRAQENLAESSGAVVTIFDGKVATDPSWYILKGTNQVTTLAANIRRDGAIHTNLLGLIIIGASFGHPRLARHSQHSDTTSTDLKTITNCCIEHKIPLLIMYLGQDKRAAHLPSFTLTSLSIPATHALFEDPRARHHERDELSVPNLLDHYGPAIAAKSAQMAAHTRGNDSYPIASLAKHEAKRFRQSLRNYAADDDEEITIEIDDKKATV